MKKNDSKTTLGRELKALNGKNDFGRELRALNRKNESRS